MTERLHKPEQELYFGRTAEGWHTHLTTDMMSEPTGHMATPGSRYGADADSCAWWVVAFMVISADRYGEIDSPELLAHEMMRDSVNDADHVMDLVLDELDRLPQVVLRNLTVGGGAS